MLCEGVIHLSGYVMPEDEIPSPSELMTDSDEEDEEQKEELESEEDTSSPGLSRFWSFNEWLVTLDSLFFCYCVDVNCQEIFSQYKKCFTSWTLPK